MEKIWGLIKKMRSFRDAQSADPESRLVSMPENKRDSGSSRSACGALLVRNDGFGKNVARHFSYLYALMSANMKFYKPEWKRLLIMSFFMILQNTMFFVLWVILFQNISSLKGWGLIEIARMFGLVASSVGLSLFLFNGARSITYRVQDGSMDDFLVRPRSALPALLMSGSSPASLGDVLYGPLMWATLGDVTWSMVPQLVGLTLLSAIIFTSMMIIVFSLSFWLRGNSRFSEQLFETLIIFSMSLQHGQPLGVKLIAYTAVPAAFIAYLPTRLIGHFDPALLAQLLVATVFYAALSVWVFNAGLRRYKDADV